MVKLINGTSKQATKLILVDGAKLPSLSAATAKRTKFKGDYKTTLFLPTENILLVGTKWRGSEKTCDPYYKPDYFELGAVAWRAIESYGIGQLEIANLSSRPVDGDQIGQLVLGLLQASWKFDQYLDKSAKQTAISIFLDLAGKSLPNSSLQTKILALHRASSQARYLIEETPDRLNPSTIERYVKSSLDKNKVELTIMNKPALLKLGMNSIIAVGKGSAHEPILIHATLVPRGPVKRRICLVGKGITYDSGGLDIKTEGQMRSMKMDMAGAATMLAVTQALSTLGLNNTELHWISPFAENMISQASYKSDDIITTFSGQTVEVQNTDAEGRLCLADALSLAALQDPDYILDAATLTGSAKVAATPYYTALMGNDGQFIEDIIKIFENEGEFVVHTPLPEVLRHHVAGKLSDLINTSTLPRLGGHLTAGLFLSHFVDQRKFRNPALKLTKKQAYPWVHLDIAGSAYNDGQNTLATFGATGTAIRSLVGWVLALDQKLDK